MKNKFAIFVLIFAAGVIVGVIAVWLFFHCCNPDCCGTNEFTHIDLTGVVKSDPTEANGYFNKYFDQPVDVIGIKGFSINLAQFNAMRSIYWKNVKRVHGFRIYYGIKDGKPIKIVVGTGSPDVCDWVYVVDDAGSGPCPDMCDTESPITKPSPRQ